MALIKCDVCARSISTFSKTCPGCGRFTQYIQAVKEFKYAANSFLNENSNKQIALKSIYTEDIEAVFSAFPRFKRIVFFDAQLNSDNQIIEYAYLTLNVNMSASLSCGVVGRINGIAEQFKEYAVSELTFAGSMISELLLPDTLIAGYNINAVIPSFRDIAENSGKQFAFSEMNFLDVKAAYIHKNSVQELGQALSKYNVTQVCPERASSAAYYSYVLALALKMDNVTLSDFIIKESMPIKETAEVYSVPKREEIIAAVFRTKEDNYVEPQPLFEKQETYDASFFESIGSESKKAGMRLSIKDGRIKNSISSIRRINHLFDTHTYTPPASNRLPKRDKGIFENRVDVFRQTREGF